MKKYFAFAVFSLFLATISTTFVMAGYNLGPNNIFHMEAKAGIDLFRGDWTEGTMSNSATHLEECHLYEKQVFAQAGESGTYSEWVDKSQNSVTHRDYGPLNSDTAKVEGYWRLAQ